ncbi:hypothetical protein [Ralstonia solanacearum]|uniref:hypothetical protein n=1 Tax=Ralstonia solanacearum TaxID=305 RepID=UPI003D8089E0
MLSDAMKYFEDAYAKASASSLPNDWCDAALLGKQLANALRAQADAQPEILARVWYHPRPEENDYDVHDSSNFSSPPDCEQCIEALIVRGSHTHPAPEAAQALSEKEIKDGAYRLWLLEGHGLRKLSHYEDELRAILTRASAATVAEPSGAEASVVRAALIGLVKHVRAVPAYSKLLGDMESVDKAIALLAAQQQAETSGGFISDAKLKQFGDSQYKSGYAQGWHDKAAQQHPEPAKCQRCGADTADSCEGAGCGYLTAGNGEQQAEPVGDERAALRWLIENAQYGLQFSDGSLSKGRAPTEKEIRILIEALRAAQSGQRAGVAIQRDVVRDVVAQAIDEYAVFAMPPDADAIIDRVMAEWGAQERERAGVEEPVAKNDQECWSRDGEEFRYYSLSDLLDEYGDDYQPGDTVYAGTVVRPTAADLCNADDVLQTIAERAWDFGDEHASDFPSVDKAAEAELGALLHGWINKHLLPANFYQVVNGREYVLTEADFADRGDEE